MHRWLATLLLCMLSAKGALLDVTPVLHIRLSTNGLPAKVSR